jgi:hypothetical protein
MAPTALAPLAVVILHIHTVVVVVVAREQAVLEQPEASVVTVPEINAIQDRAVLVVEVPEVVGLEPYIALKYLVQIFNKHQRVRQAALIVLMLRLQGVLVLVAEGEGVLLLRVLTS